MLRVNEQRRKMIFKCGPCYKEYLSNKTLSNHMIARHCNICPIIFKRENLLMEHKGRKHGISAGYAYVGQQRQRRREISNVQEHDIEEGEVIDEVVVDVSDHLSEMEFGTQNTQDGGTDQGT